MLGLLVWPTNLDVRSSDGTVLASYAGHALVASTQATLVHGVAALTLAIVVVALARAGRAAGANRAAQLAIGGRPGRRGGLAGPMGLRPDPRRRDRPAGDAGRAGTAMEAINRLDGAMMPLLGALAVAGVALSRRGVLPFWLGAVGGGLAAAIIISGVGYLLLLPPMAAAAYVSGPLLLIWVTAAGIQIWRRAR